MSIERIAERKAKLFKNNESIILDFKICNPVLQPNTVCAHFGAAGMIAGYGDSYEELGDNLYTALYSMDGYAEDHETGGYIKASSIDDLKGKCAKYNAILLTKEEALKRLQAQGYLTDDESTLSKYGWLDQLEQGLNDFLGNKYHALTDTEPSYDYNLMPDSIKYGKEAACIYAYSGVYNEIVENTHVLNDPLLVADIIDCITCNSKQFATSVWPHVPDNVKTNPKVVKAAISYQSRNHDITLVDLNKQTNMLSNPDVVEAIAKDGTISDYPAIVNDPTMELPILKGLLRRGQNITNEDVAKMTKEEIINELLPYAGSWLIPHDAIPPQLFDDDNMIIAACDLDNMPENRKNDTDLIEKMCIKNPYFMVQRHDLLENNHDLMLAFIECNNVSEQDIRSCGDIINRNNYLIYDDIQLALIKKGVWSLKYASSPCDNKDLALEIIKADSNEYIFLSDRLKNDKDILTMAITNKYIDTWFNHIPQTAVSIIEDLIGEAKSICYSFANNILSNNFVYPVTWGTVPKYLLTDKILAHLIHMSYYQLGSDCAFDLNKNNGTPISAKLIADVMSIDPTSMSTTFFVKDVQKFYPQTLSDPKVKKNIDEYNQHQAAINKEVDNGRLNEWMRGQMITV